MPEELKNLLDPEDTCLWLHISYPTLNRWIKSGKIGVIKIRGRNYFTKQEVERLMLRRESE
jgi:excisionase family DNA binding protein